MLKQLRAITRRSDEAALKSPVSEMMLKWLPGYVRRNTRCPTSVIHSFMNQLRTKKIRSSFLKVLNSTVMGSVVDSAFFQNVIALGNTTRHHSRLKMEFRTQQGLRSANTRPPTKSTRNKTRSPQGREGDLCREQHHLRHLPLA